MILVALTSNKFIINGEDKLIIYNISSNKKIFEKEGNSFNITYNPLVIISNLENKNLKILLCGCKKYIKGQKNEILLIKILNKHHFEYEIDIKFYDMEDFEINAICEILITIEPEELMKINNNNKYCLVGGFDNTKKRGVVKLYKIFVDSNIKYTNFEYRVRDTLVI